MLASHSRFISFSRCLHFPFYLINAVISKFRFFLVKIGTFGNNMSETPNATMIIIILLLLVRDKWQTSFWVWLFRITQQTLKFKLYKMCVRTVIKEDEGAHLRSLGQPCTKC